MCRVHNIDFSINLSHNISRTFNSQTYTVEQQD